MSRLEGIENYKPPLSWKQIRDKKLWIYADKAPDNRKLNRNENRDTMRSAER